MKNGPGQPPAVRFEFEEKPVSQAWPVSLSCLQVPTLLLSTYGLPGIEVKEKEKNRRHFMIQKVKSNVEFRTRNIEYRGRR
jgi:hypothetical protein